MFEQRKQQSTTQGCHADNAEFRQFKISNVVSHIAVGYTVIQHDL